MLPLTSHRGFRIGLTGGIGSGKSTVARLLNELGALVIDTDAIARTLTEPGGAAMAAISSAFGPEFVTPEGAMDRGRMRALVFRDPARRRQLQEILHPLILDQALKQADAADDPVIVFDVPLLTESGHWRQRVDQVWVVDCEESTQIERVKNRNHWSAEEVRAVMDQQASRAQRLAIADVVIANDSVSLQALRQALAQLMNGLPKNVAPCPNR
jgi:dephospho-CoA kinase